MHGSAQRSAGSGRSEKDELGDQLGALKAEVDDPPDRFRDPIMLTLMDEPVVISSGHHFDRATLYDARDRFRFKQLFLVDWTPTAALQPRLGWRRPDLRRRLERLHQVPRPSSPSTSGCRGPSRRR